MTAEERLQELMKLGYNIDIECKSINRVYALTYEAVGRKDGIICAGAAVGNTLDELVTNLAESIKRFSGGKADSEVITC